MTVFCEQDDEYLDFISLELLKRHQLCELCLKLPESELYLLYVDMFAILCAVYGEGVPSGSPLHARTNLINVGDVLHRFVLASVGKKGVSG